MPRKPRTDDFLKGRSVQDLLDMDIDEFNDLDRQKLSKVVSRLASASNKRLKMFEQKGIETQATKYAEWSGGKFSTKGKDLNALRSEFVRAKEFLKAKTSTITGYNEVKSRTQEELKRAGVELTDDQYKDFWKAYERIKKVDPSVSDKKMKYLVLEELHNIMESGYMDEDNLVETVLGRMEEIYERYEGKQQKTDVSSFFDID